jgi:hypothetical protein
MIYKTPRNNHRDVIIACKLRRHIVQRVMIDFGKLLLGLKDDQVGDGSLVDLAEVWNLVWMKDEIATLANEFLWRVA